MQGLYNINNQYNLRGYPKYDNSGEVMIPLRQIFSNAVDVYNDAHWFHFMDKTLRTTERQHRWVYWNFEQES